MSSLLARALAGGEARGPQLTGRQTEILRRVALGHSSKEIARQPDLSVKTIETHRAQILRHRGGAPLSAR